MKRFVNRSITRLAAGWQNMRTSLWFIPAVLTLFTGALSFVLLALDRRYYAYIGSHFPWLFEGSASAARSLLSTLAASVITVISIAFSLMIIAVQQASVQFTPRVLRNFTSDRGNRVVLGAYLATFVYSLLVLRAIRDPVPGSDGGFVPALATTTAILLALICIGLLIYFISHIVGSLQAATIIGRVHRELLRLIDKLYPEQLAEGATDRAPSERPEIRAASHEAEITADKGGFVTRVDEHVLNRVDLGDDSWLCLCPKVGDFVVGGQVLARVGTRTALSDAVRRQISSAVVIERQRSLAQDPMFAVRQLVDIGVKALSPGINDPTTANYCIRYLGDAMCRLSQRTFPDNARILDDRRRLLYVNRPTWQEFVEGSFVQLQQNAGGKVQVTEVMLHALQQLALAAPTRQRADPIRRVVDLIEDQVAREALADTDKLVLKAGADRVRAVLDGKA